MTTIIKRDNEIVAELDDDENVLHWFHQHAPYSMDHAIKFEGYSVSYHEQEYYTLTDADVGKPFVQAWGKKWKVAEFMGNIQSRDVGKRVYKRATNAGDSEFLQVESDEQLTKRHALDA